MKKYLSFVLCIALLLPMLAFFATAETYGSATGKLIVTHINSTGNEGQGVIYSDSTAGTLSAYGTFEWWYAVSFAWDSTEQVYEVYEVRATVGSSASKGDMVIPDNGFVYCVNLGNDYISLGSGTIDYTSTAVTNSFNYAATLTVGTKAYLYGTNLFSSTVTNNGENWYDDSYVSESFIKIGVPESGLTSYNPDLSVEIDFGINAVNTTVGEGHSLLLTPAYGTTIDAQGADYSWAKVAVFDWSVDEGAYVLLSVDTSMGTGMQKTAVIPPNGFALVVTLGNDYPSLGYDTLPNYINDVSSNVYNNIANIPVGTKVYLTGIDLAAGTFEYTGDISQYYDTSAFTTNGYIRVCDTKPADAYEPNTSGILDAPKFVNSDAVYSLNDITVEWEAVSGATSYYVDVCNSTVNPNNSSFISTSTTATSVTISSSNLVVGGKYTVRVFATDGTNSSPLSSYTFVVCSDRAADSLFIGKNVIAFGDSITAWTGWVSMLYGELGVEVDNAGVAGNRTTHALDRIETDVIAKNPDLVIVNFGMNDQAVDTSTGINLTPIDEYEANYRSIIEQILATGSEVILVAVHDVCASKYGGGSPAYDQTDSSGTTYVDLYNEVVKELAVEYNVGFLDINSLAQDILEEISLDGIHLNETGHQKYCEWISDYCFEYIENYTDWSEQKAAMYEPTDVPKILINTTNSYESINKDAYVDCTIIVIDEEGGSYETLIDEASSVKIRGNSTSGADKKPYNIKFSAKTDVLGMGKNKKWSILANCFDKTMIRNISAFDFANAVGIPYTSDYRVVDLYVNGSYDGSYLIVDSVEVGSKRVDIDLDNNEFLLELDYNTEDEDCQYFYSSLYNIKFAINEPEKADLTADQLTYVTEFVTNAENAIASNDIDLISQYFDLDSMVNFYITLEFFKNVDANTSSTRFFIKEGKLYGGPIWDFDLSSGNYNENYYTSLYNSNGDSYEGLWAKNIPWYGALITNSDFLALVKARYLEIQDEIINLYSDNINGQNRIDYYLDTYGASFDRNNEIWAVNEVHHPEMQLEITPFSTYTQHIEYYRNWLASRNAWLLSYWSLDASIDASAGNYSEINGMFITNVIIGTTVAELLSDYESGAVVTLNGEILADTDVVTAGCGVSNGGASYAVVIRGDVRTDGNINMYDYMLLKRAYLENVELSTIQNYACDVNGNGRIDIVDYVIAKRYVMGTYEFSR